ncbi:hypothetical protein VXE29_09235 [Acinetobacter variabilis]|uniref:hypothetical protein n=1 Tax=Acinetobacter variabilis TaxID=70346 RepID=UPI0030FB8359
MERNYLRLRTALLTLSLSISLIACGGGGSEESASAPKEVLDNSSPVTPLPPATTRINKALSTGDARPLIQQDSATLLDWALQLAKQQQT